MNDLSIRRFEMLSRISGFLTEQLAMFNSGSLAVQLIQKLAGVVADIKQLSASQLLGFGSARAGSVVRGGVREELLSAMDKISRCAQGMDVEFAGMADKFRMPRKSADAVVVSTGNAFAEAAIKLVGEFVRYEMPPSFLDDLKAKIVALEQAIAEHQRSRAGHAAATQAIGSAFACGLDLLKQLDPIIENKLSDNPRLMMEWTNLRHVERAWTTTAPIESPAPSATQTGAPPQSS